MGTLHQAMRETWGQCGLDWRIYSRSIQRQVAVGACNASGCSRTGSTAKTAHRATDWMPVPGPGTVREARYKRKHAVPERSTCTQPQAPVQIPCPAVSTASAHAKAPCLGQCRYAALRICTCGGTRCRRRRCLVALNRLETCISSLWPVTSPPS